MNTKHTNEAFPAFDESRAYVPDPVGGVTVKYYVLHCRTKHISVDRNKLDNNIASGNFLYMDITSPSPGRLVLFYLGS